MAVSVVAAAAGHKRILNVEPGSAVLIYNNESPLAPCVVYGPLALTLADNESYSRPMPIKFLVSLDYGRHGHNLHETATISVMDMNRVIDGVSNLSSAPSALSTAWQELLERVWFACTERFVLNNCDEVQHWEKEKGTILHQTLKLALSSFEGLFEVSDQ